MTPTPHGQVPEALIDLIDAYAETRHRYGRIYNARTEAARNAVIEALSEVQALSAAPEAIAKLRHLYQNMVNGAVRDTASAKRIAEGLLAPAIEALERATPPAEQQAAPKAAPTLPEGWTDCTIEFGNDGPEVVAYGPKRMMTRLAKWLGKYFAQVIADAAPKAAPVVWLSSKQLRGVTALHGQYLPFRRQPEGRFDTPVYLEQAAPKAAPGEPSDTLFSQFLSDVMTAAGLVSHGKQCKALGDRLADMVMRLRAAPQQEAQEPATVPYQKLTNEIDQILSDPDTELSIGAKRALLWMRTWVSVPLYTAPKPAPAPLSECLRLLNSFEYEGDEDSQAKAFFKAHINEDWFFHVKNSLELALAAQGGKDA